MNTVNRKRVGTAYVGLGSHSRIWRRVVRIAALVAVAGAVGFIQHPHAVAEGAAKSFDTITEGWYYTTGVCDSELDCSSLPTASPYPENTLHVGIHAGRPVTATFIELAYSAPPEGTELMGGTLTIPVDAEPGHGSVAFDKAELIVCAVSGMVRDVDGSFSEPPSYDCDVASAMGQFHADPKPRFTFDLASFTSRWSNADMSALALLPTENAIKAQQTWHVAMWGKQNKNDAAAPITAELSFGDETTATGGGEIPSSNSGLPEAAAPAEIAPTPIEPAESADLSAGLQGGPPSAADAPEMADPVREAAPHDGNGTPAEILPARSVGSPYPIAWAMPVVLIIGMIMSGRTLSRSVTGGVSALTGQSKAH